MWLEHATLNRRVRRCSRRVLSRNTSIFPCVHPIRTAYEYRLNLTQVSKLSYNIYTDFFFLQLIKRSVFTGIVTTKVSVFKVHQMETTQVWGCLESICFTSHFSAALRNMPGIAKDACGRQAYSLRFIILLFTEAVSYFLTVFKSNYFELINTKHVVFWRYSYKSGNFSSPRCKEDILTLRL